MNPTLLESHNYFPEVVREATLPRFNCLSYSMNPEYALVRRSESNFQFEI